MDLTPGQNYGQDLKAFESFLKQRADLAKAAGVDQIKDVQATQQRILESVRLTEKQKEALAAASLALRAEYASKEEADKIKKEGKSFDDFVEKQEKELEYFEMANGKKGEALLAYYDTERALLEERNQYINEIQDIDDETRLARQTEVNAALVENERLRTEAEKKLSDEREKKAKQEAEIKLNAATKLAGSMSALLQVAGKENVAAAVAAKGIDATIATINAYKAISEALAEHDVPFAVKAANAIAAGIAGFAQVAAIASTPIPSAETGGRFMVPDTFTGVDSGLLRLNQGEVADITPRGETGSTAGEPLHITINFDGRPLIDFINDKMDSREIHGRAIVYDVGHNV